MRQSPPSRLVVSVVLLAFAWLATAGTKPAQAAFDSAGTKCRATVAKSAGRFAKSALKSIARCHKARDVDASLAAVDCNSFSGADPAGKLQGAAAKFLAGVSSRCTGSPSDLLYAACPSPCTATVPAMATFAQVVDCEVCLGRARMQDMSAEVSGTPASPLTDGGEVACHAAITKASASYFGSVMKIIAKCQAAAEKGGEDTITECTQTSYASLTSAAYLKAFNAVAAACANVTLPSATLDACGGAITVFDLAACASDGTDAAAKQVIVEALELDGSGVTTTTTIVTTTTLVGTGDPQCPDIGELLLYSHNSQVPCTTNADCTLPRTCDTALGTCSTTASLDSGWTGLAHGADINDGVRTRAKLVCPGPAPTCGECNVAGLDPEPRNCRCTNDTRTVCDQPFAADADDCGGATCDCYFGSPFPLNSGGTPACIVNRFSEDVTGTANVDTGDGAIRAALRSRVYLGATQYAPCPVCGGKCSDDQSACSFDEDCGSGPTCVQDTAGDGVRDGLCIGGESAGLSCDASGSNASSPARPAQSGGGLYSLDCLPLSGSNVSGQGLRIVLNQTTGTTSLSSNVDCDGAGAGTALCPCMVCSKDPGVPCNADADCSSQGGSCSAYSAPTSYACLSNADCSSVDLGVCGSPLAGKCSGAFNKACATNVDCTAQPAGTCNLSSCSAKGSGIFPSPNGCNGGLCSDLGGGQGQCTTGPDKAYCSGVLKADGSGILACLSDADCTPFGPQAGTCTHLERAECFLDPVSATGHADPKYPVAVSTFCVPPTSNGGINNVAGLPGPGRVVSQGETRTLCAANHAVQYQPGTGGCP